MSRVCSKTDKAHACECLQVQILRLKIKASITAVGKLMLAILMRNVLNMVIGTNLAMILIDPDITHRDAIVQEKAAIRGLVREKVTDTFLIQNTR